jgi:hypothetical protein
MLNGSMCVQYLDIRLQNSANVLGIVATYIGL